MLKLIKYEFRKQIFSQILVLIVLAILEVVYLVGLNGKDEDTVISSIVMFNAFLIIGIVFVAFENIAIYSKDLRTKQSYMLFLTPNSTYKIVGAKVITTVISILVTGALFITAIGINITITLAKYNRIGDLLKVIREIMDNTYDIDISAKYLIIFAVATIFSFLSVLVVGMCSITLSSTFLSASKLKAFVSVVFFFGIWFLNGKLQEWILPERSIVSMDPFYYECLYSVVTVIVFYVLTSYMLDKKVAV